MSGQPSQYSGGGKKAVHVKWAGKTIALGTFPAAEADEKCARAKALTRAWRSTMRPKPSREWVMLELERLQVRVVSGRLGRKGAGEEEDEESKIAEAKKAGMMPPVTDPALLRRDSLLAGRRDSLLGTRRDSITGLLSAADMTSGGANRNNSLGWPGDSGLDSLMQRRSSSLGLSVLPDDIKRRNSSLNLSSALESSGDPAIPPHRPLVGGGAAAAFEAARADHYNNMAQKARSEEQQRRASGLGLGGMGGNNMGGQMGLSVNPNQHYEMLKLHHMNLLNEIQETTLMMNLYQQQQLQQQQQQLQHQQDTSVGGGNGGGGADAQMALLLQQQQQQQNSLGGQGLGGLGGGQRLNSLGLGNGNVGSSDMQALLNQRLMSEGGNSGGGQQSEPKQEQTGQSDEEKALQERLQALKEDIARRQKEAEELEAAAKTRNSVGEKRKSDGDDLDSSKRTKTEQDEDDDE